MFSFFDGLRKNWADIEVNARDPRLEAVNWDGLGCEAAVEKTSAIVKTLPRWEVVEADAAKGTLHAIHKTRFWGFIDDIHVRIAASGHGSRLTAHSQSRIGKGDLGQNARNLRELAEALRQVR